MAQLQQRTDAWYNARKGKLTASNLGGLLGQVSYTSRKEAYKRARGKGQFAGNDATRWGTDNEPNGIKDYMVKSGNHVIATGMHIHKTYNWLAGSPDGFIGEEGLLEVKCPYNVKRDGTRAHKTIPGHYYIQMIALMEICDREWCDFTSWEPRESNFFRVYRDRETMDVLMNYLTPISSALEMDLELPPPFTSADKELIKTTIEAAMKKNVDYKFWQYIVKTTPPDADSFRPAKRVRICEATDTQGEAGDGCVPVGGEGVRAPDPEGAEAMAAETLCRLCEAKVPVQAVAGEILA